MSSGKKTSKTTKKKPKSTKPKLSQAWTFPRVSLEDAIKIVQSLENNFAGHATPASELMKPVGFKKPEDWRYQHLLQGSNLYGLTEGTGKTAIVKMKPLGNDIVVPSSALQRQEALLKAFLNVPSFKDVYEYYKGKKIPEDEFFTNTLVRNFKLPKERVPTFIEIFTTNLTYLKAFGAGGVVEKIRPPETEEGYDPNQKPTKEPKEPSATDRPRLRKFLDSCFILMPFGGWLDTYYEEIYVPATREAGLEPDRADSLFGSGQVMEQIWGRIKKSRVLIAELSGKNPNVFYELGLAHAIGKPIVLITNDIEDVPFDLRHLRVITYNINDPNWANILKQDITNFLKSAQTDPGKSIPQPFRDIGNDEEEPDL